jgi:hypothetical protein
MLNARFGFYVISFQSFIRFSTATAGDNLTTKPAPRQPQVILAKTRGKNN